MADNTTHGSRILGSLGSLDGVGSVKVTDRFATDVDDLWSALTEPGRLARWLGEVEGDLVLGGGFRARFAATGWEGTGRVEACDPPHRLLVRTHSEDEPDDHTIEVTLTADGDGTLLVAEERGMPMEHRPAYGAGIQVHLEDLGSHLFGCDRCDGPTRWEELLPAYRALAGPDDPDRAGGPA